MTDLRVIDSQETVGYIGNLLKCLAFPAYLEQIFVVDKEMYNYNDAAKIRFIFETTNKYLFFIV